MPSRGRVFLPTAKVFWGSSTNDQITLSEEQLKLLQWKQKGMGKDKIKTRLKRSTQHAVRSTQGGKITVQLSHKNQSKYPFNSPFSPTVIT